MEIETGADGAISFMQICKGETNFVGCDWCYISLVHHVLKAFFYLSSTFNQDFSVGMLNWECGWI